MHRIAICCLAVFGLLLAGGCGDDRPRSPTPGATIGAIGIYARVVRLPDSQGFPLNGRRFVQVARVLDGSPAAQAGLKPGDELLEIAGEEVASAAFAMDRIAAAPPGSTLKLRLGRGGEVVEAEVGVIAASEAFAAELGK